LYFGFHFVFIAQYFAPIANPPNFRRGQAKRSARQYWIQNPLFIVHRCSGYLTLLLRSDLRFINKDREIPIRIKLCHFHYKILAILNSNPLLFQR